MDLFTIIILAIAGWGAGVVTGLVGASAATVVTPMLVTFTAIPAYTAISISLMTDVFASSTSAYTYYKHGNIDIKGGLKLGSMAVVGALVGSYISAYIPDSALGGSAGIVTLVMGIRFLKKPLYKDIQASNEQNKFQFFKSHKRFSTVLFGLGIGLICGIVGAGGGMMMLLVLALILGYDMKMSIGTSVLIMTMTALFGAFGHYAHMTTIPWQATIITSVFGILGAFMASKFANLADEDKLSKVVGLSFVILSAVMIIQKYLF